MSDLSIRKQIFDGAAMLAYFEYFLDCPQHCLIKAGETKLAENNLALCFIRGISARGVFIWSVSVKAISAKDAFARGTCVDVGLSGISS